MNELKRINGRLIESSEELKIKELCEKNEASLYGALLDGASLYGASLDGASLDGASLNRASLDGASLDGAVYSILSLLCQVNWGALSDDLTLELMRHDAELCGEEKMNLWANGGNCPFSGNLIRGFYFREKKDIWKPGKPKLRGLKLFRALCEEKEIKI